jgi:hypothetical protein
MTEDDELSFAAKRNLQSNFPARRVNRDTGLGLEPP